MDSLRDWHASYELLRDVRYVLLRTHEPQADVARTLRALRVPERTPVGLLDQVPGRVPRMLPVFTEELPQDVVNRARAVELWTLLEWGLGIWKPSDYHFLLPSGAHVSAFIKLSNAVRVPRDGEVLATWFDPFLEDGLGVIVDSRTLTPVIDAIALRMLKHRLRLADSVVLGRYPNTQLDVSQAIDRLGASSAAILAILSVSSSGKMHAKLHHAIDVRASDAGFPNSHVEVLVSARARPASDQAWLPSPHVDAELDLGGTADNACDLCRDPARAYVVPLDSETFNGIMPAEVVAVMPSYRAYDRNSDFWELAAAAGGVVLEARPDPWIIDSRARQSLPIKIQWENLLGDADFRRVAAKRTRDALSQIPDWKTADLVLMPEGEFQLQGHSRLRASLARSLKGATWMPFPSQQDWSAELRAAVATAKNILILTLGSVTGSTLEAGLLGVQRERRDARKYTVFGFTIHSRPENPTSWKDLTNFFEARLAFGWQTYLPLDWSPLQEETRLLLAVDSASLSKGAEKFFVRRLDFCSGAIDPQEESLFWGLDPAAKLTRHALPGENLDSPATYAATAAAIQEVRFSAASQRPRRRMLDLPRALRSYFDDLIICSFLRWVQPQEAHWGWRDDVGELALNQLLNRPHVGDGPGLAAELLLALAAGKIPRHRRDQLEAHALALGSRNDRRRLHPSVELALETVASQLGREDA